VALQGIGLLDAAWQKADAYARERRQMRAPGRGKSAASADLISEHPAMRRILDSQRAWIDGGRVLAYSTALELDLLKHHPDTARREAAQRWCALVTPVIKAAFTHQAFYGGSECLQVFGGHGYVREWGIEQIVRDARVAMIYEGTNEIQAIDLLVRKVLADGGSSLSALLDDLAARLSAALPAGLDAAQASALTAPVLARFERLRQLTAHVAAAARTDATLPYWVADDYLRATALALLGWASARIDATLTADTPELATRWQAPAQALHSGVLPEFEMRVGIIAARCANALAAV